MKFHRETEFKQPEIREVPRDWKVKEVKSPDKGFGIGGQKKEQGIRKYSNKANLQIL